MKGWLKGINSNPDGTFQTGKLWNYQINYNDALVGFTPTNIGFTRLVEKKYNGNIAEASWQNADGIAKTYSYVYDGVNRLSGGFYQSNNGERAEYSEWMDYDLNGNILHLNRTAEWQTSVPNKIDELTYTYNGNRLTQIVDAKNNTSGYIGGGAVNSYDVNGNLTAMPDRRMQIEYNMLNLPNKIHSNIGATGLAMYDQEAIYRYRADGVKVGKDNWILGSVLRFSIDYLDGFHYVSGNLSYFPTTEGFYDFTQKRYIYQYKDQLGNVRMSYSKNTSTGIAEVTDQSDYYPFGLKHNNVLPSNSYKDHQYNGKELDYGGMYDYGARMYMPELGRWNTIDKLSEKYPFATNYAYVLNRPTVAVDPDGKRVYFIGGAGNDQDGWNYINRWARAFAQKGITDFWRVNASTGRNADITFTVNFRSTGYKQVMRPPNSGEIIGGLVPSMVATNEQRPVQNDMIDATVSMYRKQLKDNPLKEGEQFNLVGYSYGSVLQAQSALRLADSGQVIDNLVLIGSPISDKSDLMEQLRGNKNIKNVIRYDLKGDLLSNPKDILHFLRGGFETKLQGDDAHHFDAARPGKQADKLMQTIVQWLQQKGVKN